ncbi:hypothetical protein SGL43_03368 [Streptomyces globisporus]|uniref:Uncharacterized protein n=1 Tax=Streptomyces globisporus TaxID=1908 RepID=A0ABM9GXL7_STRGL|nr:hypothetical protein SGL43_03368 [Streptomyces globisporus]
MRGEDAGSRPPSEDRRYGARRVPYPTDTSSSRFAAWSDTDVGVWR